MKRLLSISLLAVAVAVGLGVACNAGQDEVATPSLVIPTPPTATPAPEPSPTASPTVAVPASATPLPIPSTATLPAALPATATPAPSAMPTAQGPVQYRVVFVEPDDSLNVREAAGVESDVVSTLEPGTGGLALADGSERIGESTWVAIRSVDAAGWVNDQFLTEIVSPDSFCGDPAARQVLDDFIAGFEAQRPFFMTAQETDSNRGLRIRHDWWNPEVRFEKQALAALFTGTAEQDWGSHMGSGLPLEGSFADVIEPLLEEDLLGGSEIGCNEILHGGTAGLVQLPDAYQGINFFSVYRPAAEDGNELDWGTWVVGIERWQGRYFVSFLVHYEWEI